MGVRGEGGEQVADDEQHVDEEQQEEHEGEESEGESGEQGEDGESEDDEVVVQIGDEEPPASEEKQAAPAWVKELRQRQKELAKENATLKAQLQTGKTVEAKPELPPKPKLADFDFDEEKYEQARDEWDAKKRDVDAWEANQATRKKQAEEAVRAVHENYAKSKLNLKVKDFQDAEDEALAQLDQVQQSIVIAGAANPAAMVYALGKSPAKLRELASIKDPVKFAVAVGKLEKDLKVTTRPSTKPAPDTPLRRGSGSASTTSATLERLEAEAAKTGDRTKVALYRKQMKQQGK